MRLPIFLFFIILIGCNRTPPTTPTPASVTDCDGNIYHTVTIGTQVWMVENLRTTKYRDCTPIANVTDNSAWASLSTGAYCDFENDANNVATYGRLYNGYTVLNSHNLAPQGWHIPTDAEWETLRTFLCQCTGAGNAGGKLKEAGLTHWLSPNTGADNSSGFTGLPGSRRLAFDGTFSPALGNGGTWWSTTTSTVPGYPPILGFHGLVASSADGPFSGAESMNYGNSVRCIKD